MHPTYQRQKHAATCADIFSWDLMLQDGKPIHLNGAFHVNTTILCFVVASAAEAELSALYHNRQAGIIF
jgi:hypothetical protein